LEIEQTKLNITNSLTLILDGPIISLENFAKAHSSLNTLLQEVDKEASSGEVSTHWIVSELRSGSSHATIQAFPKDEEISESHVLRVVQAFQQGLELLENQPSRPLFFNDRALKSAKDLVNLANQEIEDTISIRLVAGDRELHLTQNLAGHIDEIINPLYKSFGSVEGFLDAINIHKKPYFTVYTFYEAVKCYFRDKDLLSQAKSSLKQRVYVYGLIREREDGKKISMEVESLEILPPLDQDITARNYAGIFDGVITEFIETERYQKLGRDV